NCLAETPVRALRKDLLDRALADQQRLFTSPYDRDREPTSGEVERYLVHLLVAVVALDLVLHVGMRQHREVEEILEPRLEMAVEVGVFEHAVVLLARDIEVKLHDDAVLRERAGLVGTQHIHRAEILDGVEALDDYLAPGHRDRALAQIDRYDHWQHLGRQADGDGDREQQRLQPVALSQAVDQEHQRRHDEDEPDHQPGEAVDALVEAGELTRSHDRGGEPPEVSLPPGVDDDAGGKAADHARAHEADIGERERITWAFLPLGPFLDRHGLTCQRRLIHKDIARGNQPHVAGDQVAGGQAHDIPRHELVERDFKKLLRARRGRMFLPATASDARARPDHGR